jgi:hypothetical protein
MTKNIADLIAAAVTHKRESEVPLHDCPSELLPGRTGLKNAAAQSYMETYALLRTNIAEHSGGIFVTGPGAQSFAAIAEDEAPALVLDAAEMYDGIAKVWFPTVRVDKVFAVDSLPSFMMGLNEVLFNLGVRRIIPPDFGKRFGTPVTSFEDAVNLTREILRTTLGDDLNVLYLRSRLTDKAIAAEWDLKFITVVVLNATLDETHAGTLFNDLFFSGTTVARSIPVETKNETAEKNDVLIACRHLRAKLSGKAPTTAQRCGYSAAEGAPGCAETLVDGECPVHTDITHTDQSETSPETKTPRKPRTPRNTTPK